MELRQYITIGLKWWWLIALLAVVAAVTSYVVSTRQTPVYQATATIMVGQSIRTANLDRNDLQTSEILARTYADMAQRQPVLQRVVDTLNLTDSWQKLQERVLIQLIRDTQLLEITTEASSPEEARVTADEIAHQLILLSPTALQNREKSENQRLIRQRIEGLQAKIQAGQERVETLEAAMETLLLAEQGQEIEGEINTLEDLITGWENNHTQLLIFVESEKSPNYLAIIEPAQAEFSPIRPRVKLNTALAGMVGFLLALGVIFLLEYLDDTLKSVDDVSQILGIITLGQINQMKGKQYQEQQLVSQNLFSPEAEAYRMIRSNIQFMAVDQPVKAISVTSAIPGEGKSTTTANLGVIMAQAGLKTVIVDADLRRPTQHEIFQIPNLAGLTELLCSSELEADNYLRMTGIENLQIITSGALPPNPAELLSSKRMEQLLATLNGLADMVIYDTPPVLLVADTAVLSNRMDGTMLVIEAGRTRRDTARQAIANLQQANARLLGVVLNRVRVAKKRGQSDYYYRGYYTPNTTKATAQLARPSLRQRLIGKVR